MHVLPGPQTNGYVAVHPWVLASCVPHCVYSATATDQEYCYSEPTPSISSLKVSEAPTVTVTPNDYCQDVVSWVEVVASKVKL